MTDTVGIAGDRIRSFIERVEHIDEEIKALNEGIRLRKQDKDERDEHESLLDLYLKAMEVPAPSQAKAA